jgi:hypothetical protein
LREQLFSMIIRRVAERSSNGCWTFPYMNDLLAFGIHHWREDIRELKKEQAEVESKEGIVKRVLLRLASQKTWLAWELGDKGEGASSTTGCVGEDGAADSQCIFREVEG